MQQEVYVVIMMEGSEPKVCDVWPTLWAAQSQFDELVQMEKLRVWDLSLIKHELTGTKAIAGDDACSVQILRRTVHPLVFPAEKSS